MCRISNGDNSDFLCTLLNLHQVPLGREICNILPVLEAPLLLSTGASDLIRSMLTVSASKRASIEDICSHWWVNEGYLESCLDVAEALANQTPVRLDLLLSLAPKHINSEHMLIQPEEEDSARVSGGGRFWSFTPLRLTFLLENEDSGTLYCF